MQSGDTLQEFASLVFAMREAQKDYFTYRSRNALVKAKELERRVDARLLQLANEQPVMQTLTGLRSTV